MKIWQERREPRTRQGDGRTQYEVDYARIIHSSSFRRLSGKTQIHHGDSDFVRTRLTHSLEVAQLALGIAQRIRMICANNTDVITLVSSDALVQTLGLIHDLGHPPGGHAGEEALNAMMHEHGGFEGNGQTLRIIARLEANTETCGANLTRRTMLGTLKYPVAYREALTKKSVPVTRHASGVPLIGKEHEPPKCYLDTEEDVVEWLLEPFACRDTVQTDRLKTFDCKLLDMADDLAYSVADCDDAISLDMLNRDKLAHAMPEMLAWMAQKIGQTTDEMLDNLYASSAKRKRQTGLIINALLGCVQVAENTKIEDTLYRYQPYWTEPGDRFISDLKNVVYHEVIKSPGVQHDRMRIQRKIVELFDALTYRPMAYLPMDQRELYKEARNPHESARVICDYIAGMTDRYLIKMHERMMG